jgi:hypothetical protein
MSYVSTFRKRLKDKYKNLSDGQLVSLGLHAIADAIAESDIDQIAEPLKKIAKFLDNTYTVEVEDD